MAGQDRGGNEGMSGMAMWKVKQQYAQQIAAMPINQGVPEEDKTPPKDPNVLVAAVSLGGSTDAKQKALVRHVLIKNLEKAARTLKFKLPTSGIFADKAPVGLSALFDGQSCAGEPGPLAAEFCAKQYHLKLLEALSKLESNMTSENFIKAVLIQCFEDLDTDLLEKTGQELKDGCGAAICLTIGEYLFVVQLGQCSAILCETADGKPRPVPLGEGHSTFASPAERRRLQTVGGIIFGAGNMSDRLRLPNGMMSPVSRSLGDRQWKGQATGGHGPALLTCEPIVTSLKLQGHTAHPYLLLCASSVTRGMDPLELVETVVDYHTQPRAACGQIALQALEKADQSVHCVQCTAVQICFLPKPEEEPVKGKDEPAAKKPKLGSIPAGGATKSIRLRHILVKFLDPAAPPKHDTKGKPVTRSKDEAEAVLRGAIQELRKDSGSWKMKPKGVNDLIMFASPKFTNLCRALSECDTSKQGGSMCGDLGWVTPAQRGTMGVAFKEVTEVLQPGNWSDIATSNQGLHLIQRLA